GVDGVVVGAEGRTGTPDGAGPGVQLGHHRLHPHRTELGVVDGDDVVPLGVDRVVDDVGDGVDPGGHHFQLGHLGQALVGGVPADPVVQQLVQPVPTGELVGDRQVLVGRFAEKGGDVLHRPRRPGGDGDPDAVGARVGVDDGAGGHGQL